MNYFNEFYAGHFVPDIPYVDVAKTFCHDLFGRQGYS